MNEPDMKIPITIRLPQELVSWLGERKKDTGIPIQKTIEVALERMRKKRSVIDK